MLVVIRTLTILFWVFCGVASTASQAFAQPANISLNDTWNFITDPTHSREKEYLIASVQVYEYCDKMTVRCNWDVRNESSNYTGLAWYQENFDRPAGSDSKAVYLRLEGIYFHSRGWLSGVSANVDPESEISRQWLARMVREYYNHPSIIGWNPKIMEYVVSSVDHAKELDPARLAEIVSHTTARPLDPIKFSDIGMINKNVANLGPITRLQHAQHAEKLLFYSESVDTQLAEHLNTPGNAGFLLDSLRFKDYLMGVSIWTFNDYRSAYRGTGELSRNRAWGVVDVFRQRQRGWKDLRDENAPVEGLSLESTGAGSTRVTIFPRQLLDIPAFTLRNYKLVWAVQENRGEIPQGGYLSMPDIKPGEKSLQRDLKWSSNAEPHALELSVINPLNYAAIDSTAFFHALQKPVLNGSIPYRTNLRPVANNNAAVRLSFQKDFFLGSPHPTDRELPLFLKRF